MLNRSIGTRTVADVPLSGMRDSLSLFSPVLNPVGKSIGLLSSAGVESQALFDEGVMSNASLASISHVV
jgi:hypothetical protein